MQNWQGRKAYKPKIGRRKAGSDELNNEGSSRPCRSACPRGYGAALTDAARLKRDKGIRAPHPDSRHCLACHPRKRAPKHCQLGRQTGPSNAPMVATTRNNNLLVHENIKTNIRFNLQGVPRARPRTSGLGLATNGGGQHAGGGSHVYTNARRRGRNGPATADCLCCRGLR